MLTLKLRFKLGLELKLMLTLKFRFKLGLKLRLMLGCVRLNIEKTKNLKGFSFGEFADSIYFLDVIFKRQFFCTLLNY